MTSTSRHNSRVGARKRTKLKKWSGKVTRASHAPSVERSARDVAVSLKRSAELSRQRKSAPFRSAMSMLTFYINRAGRKMSASRKRTLEAAKDELRRLFT